MKFDELNISLKLKKHLKFLSYETLTPIQEATLIYTLNKKDVIAQAKTGSGKTLAFLLPIVEALNSKKFKVQAIILAPTRELANQISVQLRELLKYIHNIKVLTLCGGVPYKPQVLSLKHEAHIVVGTAGRVLKHIKDENLKCEDIEYFVLDEADKMLDMGFYDDILEISNYLQKNRQTMLFSATFTQNIEALANHILTNPIFVKLEFEEQNKINQLFIKDNNLDLSKEIPKLIRSFKAKSTIVFCNQKNSCEKLANLLFEQNLDVLTLHSDLEQKLRDETMTLFSNGSYPILIASDVASRGLDISDIDLVINYDLALNEKIHTHRIGRTARAGNGGVAVTFYKEDELSKALEIKEIFSDIKFEDIDEIQDNQDFKIESKHRTILINGGKKHKIRKLDIVGCLTSNIGLEKADIGKIDIFDFLSYVAIRVDKFNQIFKNLEKIKLKGKLYNCYEK